MPVEYALISQFFAFNFLYFADARATARGWFPPWYATYRFVLTFLVGASIVISLIGRGQIVRHDHARLKNPTDYLQGDRDEQWAALEREEIERQAKLGKEKEEEESDDDEGKDDDSGNADEDKGDNKDDKKDDDKEAKKDEKKDDKKEKK